MDLLWWMRATVITGFLCTAVASIVAAWMWVFPGTEPAWWMEIVGPFAVVVVYLLPFGLASVRRHHNSGAIGVLNLLLGWTFLGWAVALVWASTSVRQKP